jgi:hypothetical protein
MIARPVFPSHLRCPALLAAHAISPALAAAGEVLAMAD